jgi:hypothetical protein
MKTYEKIINLPRYVSKKHPPMSRNSRAAQFAPFAALSGFENEIKKASLTGEVRIEIDEYKAEELNRKIIYAKEKSLPVKLTYYDPEANDGHGKYSEAVGSIKEIDRIDESLVLTDRQKIKLENITEVDVEYEPEK